MNLFKQSHAEFSPDRIYRYALYRIWDESRPKVMFIGLNPSTADESIDDPTIRRCKRFAADWGYGGLIMVNLFALRATNPKVMMAHESPIGPENHLWLKKLAGKANRIIAAWGNHGGYMNQDLKVLSLLPHVMCLGITKKGKPKHPLYLPSYTKPQAAVVLDPFLGSGTVGKVAQDLARERTRHPQEVLRLG